MPEARDVLIVYHGLLPEAEKLAHALADRYGASGVWRSLPAEPVSDLEVAAGSSSLVITIGGDGTILRGSHAAAVHDLPVLGINMGRVGFMAELDSDDALDQAGWYLDGWDKGDTEPRIEVRAMVRASIAGSTEGYYHALNDVVVGRGASVRVIDLDTMIDGQPVVTYRGDGLVISTATGSTGYALALGGPVMDPSTEAFLLKPIAAHMSLQGGLLLHPGAIVDITVMNESGATLSVDGFVDRPLPVGVTVRVEKSEHNARFLRRSPPSALYRSLTRRLGMQQGALRRRSSDDREEPEMDVS